MEKPHAIIEKLQDPLRDSLLKELRQIDNKSLNDLADQLEQFRV
ncbi:hypothetical protein [Serratia sp. JSRIV001]|nr:hypothetical protein [Serratia sp. JSRIV001]